MTTEIDFLRQLLSEATPGEWKAHQCSYTGAVVSDERGEMAIGKHPDGRPDMENARLIAVLHNVGPELVAVLENACKYQQPSGATSAALAAIRREMEK